MLPLSLPQNPTVRKVLVVIVVFVLGAAAGRYSLPAKVVVKTEVKTVEKLVHDTTKDDNKNTVTVVTEDKKANGEVVTTKTVIDKDKIVTNDKSDLNVSTDSQSSQTTTYDTKSLSISALAGVQFGNSDALTYGLHVQKKLIGPIEIGLFGFTDKLLGASVGLRF